MKDFETPSQESFAELFGQSVEPTARPIVASPDGVGTWLKRQDANRRSNEILAGVVIFALLVATGLGLAVAIRNGQSGPRVSTIPGLSAVDVHGNLTNRGFKLSTDIRSRRDAEANGLSPCSWTCTDLQDRGYINRSVFVSGDGPTALTSIEVRVISLDGGRDARDAAAELFGFVASLHYAGASPTQAKAWAMKAAFKSDSIVIGKVRFSSEGTKASRTLTIRPAD